METVMRMSKPPLSQRVNVKLLVFLAIVTLPFVWFFYLFVSSVWSGGISRHGDYTEVDLKSLGYFPLDQQNGTLDDVPGPFRKLDGQRVVLKGMMFAGQSAGAKLTDFQLVYNIQKCC